MRRTAGVLVLAALGAGCLPFPLFEDVGSDPHPPAVQLLEIATQPPEIEGVAPPPVFLPPEGFQVRFENTLEDTLSIRVQFDDLGGDVVGFRIRDRDGSLDDDLTPAAVEIDIDGDGELETLSTPEFFGGTSGIVELKDIEFAPKLVGAHRLELWAEDSHGSRSAKVEFVVTVVF